MEACVDNRAFLDLASKFSPQALVALAINIPDHVGAGDAYIETIEKHAPNLVNVAVDLHELEKLYYDVRHEVDRQLSVSGEEFYSRPALFWGWVGQHTLMLTNHHEPFSYSKLQGMSKRKVEKHLAAYGQGLSWGSP